MFWFTMDFQEYFCSKCYAYPAEYASELFLDAEFFSMINSLMFAVEDYQEHCGREVRSGLYRPHRTTPSSAIQQISVVYHLPKIFEDSDEKQMRFQMDISAKMDKRGLI